MRSAKNTNCPNATKFSEKDSYNQISRIPFAVEVELTPF